jgi:hypothetical protein
MPRKTKAKLTWVDGGLMPHGSRFLLTTDANYRIVLSDTYDGIKMPLRYVAWERRFLSYVGHVDYVKIGEFRSEKKAKACCEDYNARDLVIADDDE